MTLKFGTLLRTLTKTFCSKNKNQHAHANQTVTGQKAAPQNLLPYFFNRNTLMQDATTPAIQKSSVRNLSAVSLDTTKHSIEETPGSHQRITTAQSKDLLKPFLRYQLRNPHKPPPTFMWPVTIKLSTVGGKNSKCLLT